ncbi:hypothetical protein CXB51_013674 [Gossypium anomalum]|uniref:RNase H type-1 domain-containing protein n=1 Tax=Gossypium anomalum TaxID=47600 RepID=A0A8J5Z8N9_9ROSI|nr:hypothetical protein CXB51_013674 [Gossypium anomalum]
MSANTAALDFSCEQDMCLEEPQDFEDVQDCDVSLDLLRIVKQEEKRIMPHEKEAIENIVLEEGKEVKIGTLITKNTRRSLIELVQEFKDIFAWSYQDMPGLSTDIVVHRLPIRQDCKPVQQKLRRMRPDIILKIKDEVKKQFDEGFLQELKYSEWVANIVPVPKKDGKVRMCVDYRDLNKASPKDNFPLPHVDTLVDNTAGYSLFSFMDGFSGYNQIKMHPEDMDKTTFITLWGTFCYKVMSFGLKNAGATYQRTMVNLFHDMMHKDTEVYIDDMIAKSQAEKEHIEVLRRLFLSEKGIEVDSDKVRAIQELPPPRTQKEVRGFLGRLNYIARFISQLTEKCDPIFRLLRKHNQGTWDEECQNAFEKVKQYLLNAPVLSPPSLDKPLILYLSVFSNSMGCVLGQHDESGKREKAIYYLMGNGIGAVLVSPNGYHYPFTCKLDFDCTNNMAEYETCIMGLQAAIERGIRILEVYGDSALVIYQLKGKWETRDPKLINYRKVVLGLLKEFDDITFNYLPRDENQMADALATLASMIKANKEEEIRPIQMSVHEAPASCYNLEKEEKDDNPWYKDILRYVRDRKYPEQTIENDKRTLRRLACDYVLDGDVL